MPYPYSNDLGKNLPPSSVIYSKYNSKVLGSFPKPKVEPQFLGKPMSQQDMMDILYGAHSKTLKFPDVLPLAVKKDYPGSHPANKWGKPDPAMIPDDKTDPLDKAAQDLIENIQKGLITKQEAYAQAWSGNLGSLSTQAVDPYYYKKPALQPNPNWNDQVPAPQFLGKIMNDYDYQTHSNNLTLKVKVNGLSVDDTVFGVSHKIADFAAFNMNTDMLSHVLDEAFAKLKTEIMNTVIKKAGE